jgi:hypothetical protein
MPNITGFTKGQGQSSAKAEGMYKGLDQKL